MDEKYAIKLFDEYKIRTKWDPEIEDYYYSVIDVIAVLTESKNPNRYWSDLKRKLSDESGQPYENIVRLKLKATDGKMRETDAANIKQLLRIVQSVPSPKAEPFKQIEKILNPFVKFPLRNVPRNNIPEDVACPLGSEYPVASFKAPSYG